MVVGRTGAHATANCGSNLFTTVTTLEVKEQEERGRRRGERERGRERERDRERERERERERGRERERKRENIKFDNPILKIKQKRQEAFVLYTEVVLWWEGPL